jgi:hypothetical protein
MTPQSRSKSAQGYSQFEEDISKLQEETYAEETKKKPHNNMIVPFAAVPTQNGILSPHAAEFWFPECRNCACCKGFKHGCACRKGQVTTCQDANCVDQNLSNELNSRLQSAQAQAEAQKNNNNTNNAPPELANGQTFESLATVPPPITNGYFFDVIPPNMQNQANSFPPAVESTPCKYETAPGGCRFGSACRYKHFNGAVGTYMPPNTSLIPCTYFIRGNCQYGDSCRYSHKPFGK